MKTLKNKVDLKIVKEKSLKFKYILLDLENLSSREFDEKYGEINIYQIPTFLLNKHEEIFGDFEK